MSVQGEPKTGWGLGVLTFTYSMLNLFLHLQHRLILNEKELTVHTFFYKKTIHFNDIAFITRKYIRHGKSGTNYVCLLDKEKKELASFRADLITEAKDYKGAIDCLLFIYKRSDALLSDSLQSIYPLQQRSIPLDKNVPMIRKINWWWGIVFLVVFLPLLNLFLSW